MTPNHGRTHNGVRMLSVLSRVGKLAEDRKLRTGKPGKPPYEEKLGGGTLWVAPHTEKNHKTAQQKKVKCTPYTTRSGEKETI